MCKAVFSSVIRSIGDFSISYLRRCLPGVPSAFWGLNHFAKRIISPDELSIHSLRLGMILSGEQVGHSLWRQWGFSISHTDALARLYLLDKISTVFSFILAIELFIAFTTDSKFSQMPHAHWTQAALFMSLTWDLGLSPLNAEREMACSGKAALNISYTSLRMNFNTRIALPDLVLFGEGLETSWLV